MAFHFESVKDLNSLLADFIRTDLEVALTFVAIASQTDDGAKARRNRENARKAYDTVLRYLDSTNLSRFEQENITKKMALLKAALVRLGESF